MKAVILLSVALTSGIAGIVLDEPKKNNLTVANSSPNKTDYLLRPDTTNIGGVDAPPSKAMIDYDNQFDMSSIFINPDAANISRQENSQQNTVRSYKERAHREDREAQYRLGVLYLTGDGSLQDFEQAIKWLNLAAEGGYAPAQYKLGLIYRTGSGTPVNHELSYIWLNLAAAGGIKEAAAIRNKVITSLSAEQLAQAQKTSQEWLSSRSRIAPPSLFRGTPKSDSESTVGWIKS